MQPAVLKEWLLSVYVHCFAGLLNNSSTYHYTSFTPEDLSEKVVSDPHQQLSLALVFQRCAVAHSSLSVMYTRYQLNQQHHPLQLLETPC